MADINNELKYLISTLPEEELQNTLLKLKNNENKQALLDLGLVYKYSIGAIEQIITEELETRKKENREEKTVEESFSDFINDIFRIR